MIRRIITVIHGKWGFCMEMDASHQLTSTLLSPSSLLTNGGSSGCSSYQLITCPYGAQIKQLHSHSYYCRDATVRLCLYMVPQLWLHTWLRRSREGGYTLCLHTYMWYVIQIDEKVHEYKVKMSAESIEIKICSPSCSQPCSPSHLPPCSQSHSLSLLLPCSQPCSLSCSPWH